MFYRYTIYNTTKILYTFVYMLTKSFFSECAQVKLIRLSLGLGYVFLSLMKQLLWLVSLLLDSQRYCFCLLVSFDRDNHPKNATTIQCLTFFTLIFGILFRIQASQSSEFVSLHKLLKTSAIKVLD